MFTFLDSGSFVIALITIALFILAFTWPILSPIASVEVSVFLVSMKLLAMAHKIQQQEARLNEKLDRIMVKLEIPA